MTAAKDKQPGFHPAAQFRLTSLLEYVTWCAILSACSAVIGVPASVFLMLMALALWGRQGWLALAMLMGALLAADYTPQDRFLSDSADWQRQLVAVLLTAALCAWYRIRRKYSGQ